MKLHEIHNCPKSKGKIVCITIDKVGVTKCNYCNRVVDYTGFMKQVRGVNDGIKMSWM